MPSSGINNHEKWSARDSKAIMDAMQSAIKYGLQWEWLQWYTAGIKQGMTPRQAALHAAIEWDL